jgi:hypothetical protein
MAEEIEHREHARKLEKQLKREAYEARKLEEERKAKELEANEVLLRERMQSKYSVLEEKKREAREEARRLELEKKKKKEDDALRKALPGLYREVARETGEYTDNIGNTATAVPRRLGGAVSLAPHQPAAGGGGAGGHAGSVDSSVVRRETVRAAQERLDDQVVRGELPDQETLAGLEQTRRAEARALQRKTEADRVKKALPNICSSAGDTLGSANPALALMGAAGAAGGGSDPIDGLSVARRAEMQGGSSSSSSSSSAAVARDPSGRYAGAAAAAAAERREAELEEAGVLDVERARVERERAEREWMEKEAEKRAREAQVCQKSPASAEKSPIFAVERNLPTLRNEPYINVERTPLTPLTINVERIPLTRLLRSAAARG